MSRRDDEERKFIESATRKFSEDFVAKLIHGDPPDPHPFAGLNADAGAGCPDAAPATADDERINPAPAGPTRHARALAWRKSIRMSRHQLAERTGFSVSVIRDFEAGARRGQKPEHAAIDEASWLRYSLACAALDSGLDPLF